jgi:nitrogenase molybdenum-iron protein alpha/beta subunit
VFNNGSFNKTMNWLKNIFKKKEPVEVVPIESVSTDIQEPQETKIRGECWWCKTYVYEDERYAKQQGKLFHKKCYNESKRQARGLGIG